MKTIAASLLGVLCSLLLLAPSGCSDSIEGDPGASLASCNEYCDAYIGAHCPDYVDLDECKFVECSDIPAQPTICQSKLKTYYDCRKAQTDVCQFEPDPCDAEFKALLMCS